jgi:uncharacterized protein YggE
MHAAYPTVPAADRLAGRRLTRRRRALAVNGQAEVKVAPDLAIVSFAVETTSPDARTAVAERRKSTASPTP